MKRSQRVGLGALIMLGAIATAPAQEAKAPIQRVARIDKLDLNIPAKPLDEALVDLAAKSGLHIVLYAEYGEGITSPSIRGSLTADEALKLLLAHTSLRYEYLDSNSVAVLAKSTKVPANATEYNTTAGNERLADSSPTGSGVSALNDLPAASSSSDDSSSYQNDQSQKKPIEEVLVTGSHINGQEPVGSPLLVFSKEDIARSGATTIDQFIEMLPQNFHGGASRGTGASLNADARANYGSGATINLRGLGSGTTLVLLNGHRMATAGADGSFVDITLIPASAIERVEILTDGSSAIYGSDAVGGVANFILKKDYDGAATTLGYGSASGNVANEWRGSQIVGTQWTDGGVMAVYDFNQSGPVRASDRSYASEVPLQSATLLPEQKQNSLLVSANQKVSDRFAVSADVLASRRDASSVYGNDTTSPFPTLTKNEQITAALNGKYELSDTWDVQVSGVYSRNTISDFHHESPEDGQDFFGHYKNDEYSADATVSGRLLTLPGGDLRTAFGGGFRREDSSFNDNDPAMAEGHRETSSAFAELLIPFIGANNEVRGAHRLELSLAGRFDHYSDFGSSKVPKIGLKFSTVDGVNFRGSFSRSFRAPLIQNLIESPFFLLYNFPDPASNTGTTLAIANDSIGNNNLGAEKSRNWTGGFDIHLPSSPFTVSATYYNISFTDRVARPANSLLDVFPDAAAFNSVITRNPSLQTITDLIASVPPSAFHSLVGPYNPADIAALIDFRIRNIAIERESGIDLNISSHFATSVGAVDASLAGTYILQMERALTPTAPVIVQLNRLESPTDLHIRGQLGWSRNGFGTTAAVNYVNGYTDNVADPNTAISSWTTVDLQIRYETGITSSASLLKNLSFSLSAINLFDKAPPFTASTLDLRGYDPSNGSPLGRFITFEVSKRW